MAELFCDDLEAQRWAVTSTQSLSRPAPWSRREVPDLLSWVQCFGTYMYMYMTIVLSKHPHHMKELMAYQTLIVRKADIDCAEEDG